LEGNFTFGTHDGEAIIALELVEAGLEVNEGSNEYKMIETPID